MQEIVLDRTGDRPLAFDGESLATADTQTQDGPTSSRWWDLTIFRTEAKPATAESPEKLAQWVLAIAYRTRFQGERPTDSVIVAKNDDELASLAKQFNPLAGLRGYPPGNDERQQALESALLAAWKEGLSNILHVLGPEKL